MKIITAPQFQALIQDATIIHPGPLGPKVYLNTNNAALKLFYRKESWKRRLFPNAVRFIKLAKRLTERNITTVAPIEHYYCSALKIDIVSYPWLEGACLRDKVQQGDFSKLDSYARFLAALHQKNIYFRGAHLGNILLLNDHRFALIDICNLKFRMNFRHRIKNISYVLNHWMDRDRLQQYGRERFVRAYLDATDFSEKEKRLFLTKITKLYGL